MIKNNLDVLSRLAGLVKFSHTIFALPFALAMLIIVSAHYAIEISQVIYLLLALVCARTAAMGFNRIIDRKIDAANPRTQQRELVVGSVSIAQAVTLTVVSVISFVGLAALLGAHCLAMSPLVLTVLLGYSLTKRFTSAAHTVLGIALSMAPGGVWYAITARFAWEPVWLMLAVLTWVMGFDILYSCQDYEFDRQQGLFSLPARIGINRAFYIARLAHAASLIFLLVFGLHLTLGFAYYIGCLAFGWALFSQHKIISPDNLSRIDQAFFVRNALASVFFLAGVTIDRLY